MLVLISYDIENDKLRAKVAKILEGHGERVQYSVFECHLRVKDYNRLKGRLTGLLDKASEKETKSIRLYRLCAPCEGRLEIIGSGSITTDESFYIA